MLEVTALRLNLPRSRAQEPVPISFALKKGQLLWIRGENGAGKSTLLKTIIGILEPIGGQIHWPQGRPPVFYLSHELALARSLTVLEYCQWHPALVQSPSNAEVQAALKALHLLPQAHQLCGQLSRGQQQRLVLAVAQLSQAPLWILDEPFTALDSHSRALIVQVLLAHKNQGGAALVVSHHPVEELFDEVIDVVA